MKFKKAMKIDPVGGSEAPYTKQADVKNKRGS